MIRSTKHTIKFANKDKQTEVACLVGNYRLILQDIVDHLWDNDLEIYSKNKLIFHLNIEKNHLDCPTMLDNEFLQQFQSYGFTMRMIQCIGKQACAMIKAAPEKRRKQFFQLKKLQKEEKNTKYLQRKIDNFPLVKPNCENAVPELDSRFFDIEETEKHFDCFLQIKCIGQKKKIRIPTKHTKVSRHWQSMGRRMGSIRLSEKFVSFNFEIEPKECSGTRTVGADQGMVTCLILSDGQATESCPHGHDLASILDGMTHQSEKNKGKRSDKKQHLKNKKSFSSKKSASKNFKAKQSHRKNYINWSINQLDFSDIKEVRFEEIKNIKSGKRNSQNKQHWVYLDIKKKLEMKCEEWSVKFTEVPNEFRSQRCSSCGFVCKSSRKGKTFTCAVCGFTTDADLNAASNLEIDLFEIPFWVRSSKMNRAGFYWKPDGLFSGTGERIVPQASQNKLLGNVSL